MRMLLMLRLLLLWLLLFVCLAVVVVVAVVVVAWRCLDSEIWTVQQQTANFEFWKQDMDDGQATRRQKETNNKQQTMSYAQGNHNGSGAPLATLTTSANTTKHSQATIHGIQITNNSFNLLYVQALQKRVSMQRNTQNCKREDATHKTNIFHWYNSRIPSAQDRIW